MLSAPIWIFIALISTLVIGLLVLRVGPLLPRQGDWLVGVGLVGLIVTIILNRDEAAWLRGWIWPRAETGSIGVGFLIDNIGLAMSILACALAGLSVVQRPLISREERPERTYGAAAISSCGVALAWLSLTPWLSFGGLVLTIVGGFVGLGSRWNSDEEAAVAARFVRERTWGLVIMVVGASAMASSGALLSWEPASLTAHASADALGALLLVLGLAIQLQPFPFLGWLVMPSESYPPARMTFAQLFPAFAAFAVLIRFEPLFRSIGIFPAFGWFPLVSAVLTIFVGLLQPHWRSSLRCWTSAAFSVSLAALTFSGPWACTAILVGVSLPSAAISMFGTSIEGGGPANTRSEGLWAKIGIFAAAAAGSGFIGFVTAGGGIRWLMSGLAGNLSYVFAFVLFLSALLLWKLAWTLYRKPDVVTPPWFFLVPPILVLLGALGIIWSGSFTGGALLGGGDQVGVSLLNDAFQDKLASSDEVAFWSSSWIHWEALVAALLTAWWTAGREHNLWERLRRRFPSGTAYFGGGFGVDLVASKVLFGAVWLGRAVQNTVDEKIWQEWIPGALHWSTVKASRGATVADRSIGRFLNRFVQRSTEVPGKVLQLIQSGDIQWYLFFAIGSGIAILIHFLRF